LLWGYVASRPLVSLIADGMQDTYRRETRHSGAHSASEGQSWGIMPPMSNDHPRPDNGHPDTSSHDQTADMSMDTALSIREAAARVDVTEKTIRRWIKSGRLHAVKFGGQYRITVADLEHARDTTPDAGVQDVQTQDVHSLDTGQGPSEVDMSPRPDSGQEGQGSAVVDLRPLVDHIASLEGQVQQLSAAAAFWQVRATQAEEELKQLTAGPVAADQDDTQHQDTPPGVTALAQSDDSAPQGIWAWLRRLVGG
jgi:excisionase family DNA binding protein